MLVGVLCSWFILCVVVSAVAKSVGRNAGNYFLLSLLLSPLVGFLVLAIKGKATPDEMLNEKLNETKHIFYCPKCNSTYSGNGDKEQICPDCNLALIETTVLADDWRTFPADKKDSLKHSFAEGQFLRSNLGKALPNTPPQNSGADELKKYKELLDMGAITAEEYEAKKKQILGL